MQDPTVLLSNPFASLSAIAGPAILTNACSVLALGTSNRLGRVVVVGQGKGGRRASAMAVLALLLKDGRHVLVVRDLDRWRRRSAGGVGVAEVLPLVRGLRRVGNNVIALCGSRSADHILLDAELREAANELRWATEDGTAGFRGTVVDLMRQWKQERSGHVDAVFSIGPVLMMKAVAELTRIWAARTFASLNPIMIDGTGMCGGCRVTVGGRVRFACVEGPEFDAHEVDFDELAARNRAYQEMEREAFERYECRRSAATLA
jgi:hypothetical protein